MQNSSLAQSAVDPHAVALLSEIVGSFGHIDDPGVTHAPVV